MTNRFHNSLGSISRLSVYGAGLFWLVGGGYPALAAEPPGAIFGVYAKRGRPQDSVKVVPQENGKIGVAVNLTYANGHTCSIEKSGDWRNGSVVIVADGLTENEPCNLKLTFAGGGVTLSDSAMRCSKVYCGARGTLDGVTLPKKQKQRSSVHNPQSRSQKFSLEEPHVP